MNKRNWLVYVISIILLCVGSLDTYPENKPTSKPSQQIKFLSTGKGCISCPEVKEASVELLGFTTLDNPYLSKTIQSLIIFQRKHPEVEVRGVLIISFPEDMELLTQKAYLWGQEIPVGADLFMKQVKAYGITTIPTFVFVDNDNDRAYKIAGQPNLEEVYEKYVKKIETAGVKKDEENQLK